MRRTRRGSDSPVGSVGAQLRRGPGRVARTVPVVLVLALLGAAVAADRWDWGRALGWEETPAGPDEIPPPPGLVLPEVPEPPVVAEAVGASQAGSPDPAAVRRALRRALRDPDLGPHVVAYVGDLGEGEGGGAAGEPAYSSGRGRFVPASTTKLLTGAAALQALGPDARFTTSVVRGDRPRDLVLVGGGDPYLASGPAAEDQPLYPPRADLATLATATAAALTEQAVAGRVRVRYDARLFTGPAENPAWRPDYVPDQVVAPIHALAVEGGRTEDGWGRSPDPAREAARAFAARLRQAGVDVAPRVRPVGEDAPGADAAVELAAVESAPLDQVVGHALAISDNEATEMLAMHVGLAVSGEGSFAAGTSGVLQVLAGLGVDVAGDVVRDGSGLSRENRLAPATLAEVVRLAASEDHPGLRGVLDGLPVAGFSGSLTFRFSDGAPAGLGMVRAKTGTLTGVHALAGLVTDRDGTVMPFVVAADQVPADRSLEARLALDRAAAALAACRCGLGERG